MKVQASPCSVCGRKYAIWRRGKWQCGVCIAEAKAAAAKKPKREPAPEVYVPKVYKVEIEE